MKTTYSTLNSVYEVDHDALTIERISGVNAPNGHFAGGGPKPFEFYAEAERLGGVCLLIVWPDGAHTTTSLVTRIERTIGDAVPLDELEAFLR